MLKRVTVNEEGAQMKIKDAIYPEPFVSGLEYGAPARGMWNIVHTGMLIPEAHEIFVCADNCLRGVVLTAAEMNAEERFSTISIRESNVLVGDMERLIIDGVSDILAKLPKKPRAVLVYTSCIHHFIGCDLHMVYETLRKKFPDIDFTDCYMNPIMRKSGLTPDQLTRRGMYDLWQKVPLKEKEINIVGNNLPTDKTCELIELAQAGGYQVHELQDCCNYDEYQQMAQNGINISYLPAAYECGEFLKGKYGQKHLYLPLSYDYSEIERSLGILINKLGLNNVDFASFEQKADQALAEAKALIGDCPIAIDYTATVRPFGLAKLLCEHGFNVKIIYVDSIISEDKDAFEWLKANRGDITLSATVHNKMRVLPRTYEEKILCIGQKAAYFLGSNYFVNIIEGGGHYGFDGICRLCNEMMDGFVNEKIAKDIIQHKGLGCACRL